MKIKFLFYYFFFFLGGGGGGEGSQGGCEQRIEVFVRIPKKKIGGGGGAGSGSGGQGCVNEELKFL